MSREAPGTVNVGRIALLHSRRERAETLAQTLRFVGHRVTIVLEGAGAAAALLEASPDLVIASHSFEEPPLIDLINGLRWTLAEEVPLLIVVGREEATPPPLADDIIWEPVNPREFTLRVGNLMRMRLERRLLQRKLDELQGLHRVSWHFSLAGGAEAFFGQLARLSAELVKARKGLVVLFDSEHREAVAQPPGFGFNPSQVAAVRFGVDGDPRSRWNFRTNGPLLSNEPLSDPRLLPGIATTLDLHSLLVMPLTRGPKVMGALVAADRIDGRPFREDDLNLLQLVAGQASAGVENFRLHQELKQANAMLQEYDRLKNEFVAMVAHDFRSPLMAIRGFAELVLEDDDIGQQKRQEFMRTIINETDDLARLAGDMFLITQMEAGRFDYYFTEIELGPFILDGVARVHADHPLVVDVPPRLPKLTADPERLRQVLANLTSNAVKYSPDGGSVTVRCRERTPAHVLIEIIDHGLGIPADQIGRLFRKFERVRTGRHAVIAGTGLGLYICRLIVEGHGGRIWAESVLGKGSTFSVLLPRVPPGAVSKAASTAVTAAPDPQAEPQSSASG